VILLDAPTEPGSRRLSVTGDFDLEESSLQEKGKRRATTKRLTQSFRVGVAERASLAGNCQSVLARRIILMPMRTRPPSGSLAAQLQARSTRDPAPTPGTANPTRRPVIDSSAADGQFGRPRYSPAPCIDEVSPRWDSRTQGCRRGSGPSVACKLRRKRADGGRVHHGNQDIRRAQPIGNCQAGAGTLRNTTRDCVRLSRGARACPSPAR